MGRSRNRKKTHKTKRRFTKRGSLSAKVTGNPIIIPESGPVAGFSTEFANKGQETTIEVAGYHAFDEGLLFYKMLEHLDRYAIAAQISTSRIERMLVIQSATESRIYINDNLQLRMNMRSKVSLKKGQAIYADDIAGIESLSFQNVELYPQCGFTLLLSAGWRKGMCFDYRPLSPRNTTATPTTAEEAFMNIKSMGGMLASHLFFTEKFLLSSTDWEQIIDAGWFPFLQISEKCWNTLSAAIRAKANLDSCEEEIHNEFMIAADGRLESWKNNLFLKDDYGFLSDAIEAYKSGKWAACAIITIPRIEGLLCKAFNIPKAIKSRKFLDQLKSELASREHVKSLLFGDQFIKYLDKCIYPKTNITVPEPSPNRPSISHGRVQYKDLTRKVALTTLLLIDNLMYCMPRQ